MIQAFLPLYTLWQREIIRFLRQKNRVFSALFQPILFWLVFGSSFGASFRPAGVTETSYLEYFYPGILMMILLFTAIFASFSTLEDRNEGFLQAAFVSSAPRWQLVLGKVMGGATIALLQALVFLFFAPWMGFSLSSLLPVICALALAAMGLSAFGFMLAWQMDSIQGFHALMMLILLPMWFLSGAFFPAKGLPLMMDWLLKVNPLTYALSLVRHLLYETNHPLLESFPSFETSVGVTVLFVMITLFGAWKASQRWK